MMYNDFMEEEYRIYYFKNKKGAEPVRDYINSFTLKIQAKIYKFLDVLERKNINMPFPFSSHIKDKIFELRIQHGSNRYRIFYFIYNKRIILLHGIVKKTEKIPPAELAIAEKNMKEFFALEGVDKKWN